MKKFCSVLISIILAAGLLCSCESPEPQNIAVVAAIANNNTVFNPEIPEVADLASIPDTTYSFILASSSPTVICEGAIPSFKGKGYTHDTLTGIQSSIHTGLSVKLAEAVPSSPEVDIASATDLALRALHTHMTAGRKNYLIYYASMISTSGLINMVETPVCELDVEATVENLTSRLKWDMSEINVIVYCCGDTAGKQLSLSKEERNKLEIFYEKLFYASGADDVQFRTNNPLDGTYSFEQPVSEMRTAGIESAIIPIRVASDSVEDTASALDDDEVLVFPEEVIAFMPDSTELVDAEAAKEAISHVVDYMNQNDDFEILLSATTTSYGEKESSIAFSLKRADSVAKLFYASGIAPDRIHCVGCGWSSCLYVLDRDENGNLDEEIAPRNRAVQITAYDSPAAQKILNSLNG